MKRLLPFIATFSLCLSMFAQEPTTSLGLVQSSAIQERPKPIPNFRHPAHLKLETCDQEDLEAQKTCAQEALAHFIEEHLKFPVHGDPEIRDFGCLLYEFHIDTNGQLQAAHLIRNTTPSNAYLLEAERVITLLKELEWHPAVTREGQALTAPLLVPIRFLKG